MIGKLIVLALAAAVQQSEALKLPPYIKACARTDPKFNECAKRNGQLAIATLIHGKYAGDRKYRLPNMNPFIVTQLSVNQGNNLKIHLTDDKVYGLDKTIIKKVNVDFNKRKGDLELFIPAMNMQAKYNISGRILILPITGSGDSNMTMVDLNVKYSFSYDIYKSKTTLQDHVRPKKGKITYTTSRINIYLANLFNGDKLLGPETNVFLNENWKEVNSDLGPTVAGAVAEIIHSIITNVCELVPYEELFPEKL